MSTQAEVVPSLASLEAPLTAAGNFLAGVTTRRRNLAGAPDTPVEAREHLLEGIHAAIDQLTLAATIATALLPKGASDASA